MKKVLSIALVLVFSLLATHATASDKPSITSSQTMKLTAQVMAIDMQRKTVTLRGPEGNERTIELGEEARRLDEVEVGDIVYAEYEQKLSIKVMASGGAGPGGGTMSTMKRAPDSELPGVVMTDTTISSATVAEINLQENTFKLKWADGGVKQYEAQNPENLKKAEVGDLVVVTYTEAIALSLQEVPEK